MVYRGRIQNGQIVLDGTPSLPEGSAVLVEPVDQRDGLGRGSAAGIIAALRPWEGPGDELDRLLAEVQGLRELDVLPTRDHLE
jgi:hypothetical protein